MLPLERPFLLKQNFDCSQGKEGYGMDPSKLVLYQSDNIAVEKSKFVMWLSPIPFGRIYVLCGFHPFPSEESMKEEPESKKIKAASLIK